MSVCFQAYEELWPSLASAQQFAFIRTSPHPLFPQPLWLRTSFCEEHLTFHWLKLLNSVLQEVNIFPLDERYLWE